MPAFATATVTGPSARSASPSRSAVRASAGSRTSPSATRAPASWKACAMPKPIPAPAPVTTTTESVKSSTPRRLLPPRSALLAARIDLGDLLVALLEGARGLPVVDEHALDHLRDHVGVQHLARGGRRRARIAHRHAGLRHLDEVLERGLAGPERALEQALVHGHPAAARRLDDLVVVRRLHEVLDEPLRQIRIGRLLERAVRPGVDL